jgi:hypothetical protein
MELGEKVIDPLGSIPLRRVARVGNLGSIGLPYRVLVNREMQVTDSNGGVSDADVRGLVAE